MQRFGQRTLGMLLSDGRTGQGAHAAAPIQKLTGGGKRRTSPNWGLPPGVRYAGLDRSAVVSRKYFTALALSKGLICGSRGTAPLYYPPYTKTIHYPLH